MFGDVEHMEHIAKRIVDMVIDTYVDNLAERKDGTIVIESQWMKDMRQAIISAITDYECERLENERPRAAAQLPGFERPVRTDVWVGGRSDGEARL
jgi:hypothetical protein